MVHGDMREFIQAFDSDVRLLEFEYAGMLLRESDLDDIAHYFVYTADDWAAAYLGPSEIGWHLR